MIVNVILHIKVIAKCIVLFVFVLHQRSMFLLIHRYALRRRLSVMTFEFIFPYPNSSFIPFMLDIHPSLHKLSHFDIAADHMIYNKKEFQQVMPKDTVYISSLREPVAQFKSAVNWLAVRISTG